MARWDTTPTNAEVQPLREIREVILGTASNRGIRAIIREGSKDKEPWFQDNCKDRPTEIRDGSLY